MRCLSVGGGREIKKWVGKGRRNGMKGEFAKGKEGEKSIERVD